MRYHYILILSTLLFSQQTKSYSISLKDFQPNKLKIESPNGSNLYISGNTSQTATIEIKIEVPNKFAEELKNLPSDAPVVNTFSNNTVLNFDFIEEALSKKSKQGLISKLIGSFGGDGDVSINGKKYRMKDGVQYEILSHFVIINISLPKSQFVDIEHKYGELSIEKLSANVLSIKSYESQLTLEKITADIELSNKYNTTKVVDVNGNVNAELYESITTVSNISGNLILENKYESSKIEQIKGQAHIVLYESNSIIDHVAGSLELQNKYKPTQISHIQGDAKIALYESKATLKNFGGKLTLENKYENTTLEAIKGAVLVNLYESKLTALNIDSDLRGVIKYGLTKFNNILGNIELELYESPIQINASGDIVLKAKYGNINLEGNFKAVDINSYESNIQLDVPNTFKSPINIQNKYGNITLQNLNLEEFKLKGKTKDGRINIPFLDTDPDESSVTFQWHKDSLPAITLGNYDGNITIK